MGSDVARPLQVLELRSVRGTGGGPEKTILLGAAASNLQRVRPTVCYVRDRRDDIFSIDKQAMALGVDYVEVHERHSFDPAAWIQLRRIVREREIDIVHAHDYKTNLMALFLARTERIIPLSTVHGWTGHSRRERWLYYPVDKRVLSRFPRLIAVSSEIRQVLVRSGARPANVTTILNGIDHVRFRRDRTREIPQRRELGLNQDDVVIGSVGRLEPQKRFDLLLEAVAEIRRARPRVCLVIAGAGSLSDQLAAMARARFPQGGCLLLGHRTDIRELHHAFDVFVQSSAYEGTPNAVLEAMALETPVVATDVGGTSELIQHEVHGLIVSPGSVSALSEAVQSAIDDRASARARAAAARRRIEQTLSFEARMRAVETIYFDLIARRDASAPIASVQMT
jgi:glycosyltransferase involved in cell wall biosynthesis